MDVKQPFICLRCNKNFKTNQGLQRHISNKKPCTIEAIANVDNNNCIYCKKIYSTKFNLIKHQKICKMKNGGIAEIQDPNVRLAEQIRILAEEREKERIEREKERIEHKRKEEKMEKEIAEISAIMKEMLLRPSVASAVNNTTNNIGCNITINNYTTPNVGHLLEFDTFRKMFGKFDIDLPIEFMLNVYFDPSHPENESIHLINKETKHVLAKTDGVWSTFNIDVITERLRELGYKYAAEGIRMHFNPEYPERRAYIVQKMPVIERFKHQKINTKNIEYENKLIEERLVSQFDTSSQHPMVIADHERRKRELTAAKNGVML